MGVLDKHGHWGNLSTDPKGEASKTEEAKAYPDKKEDADELKGVVPPRPRTHDDAMSDMTRDEIKLYLDTARADAKASAADVAKSQAELRADIKEGMAGFSIEVANLKGEFQASIATQTKWIAAMVFGALAAFAAIFGMLKATPPATPPPAPYVIYAQPPAAPAVVTAAPQHPQQAPASPGSKQ